MKNKLLYIVMLFVTLTAVCQERKILEGKVVSDVTGVPNVYVINKTTGLEVKTDYKGFFTIEANPGDKLVVYNAKIIVREFKLLPDSFKEQPYVISVNYNAYELDEVVIDKYGKIDAETLGLVPKGQLQRTVAERRLYTAGAKDMLKELAEKACIFLRETFEDDVRNQNETEKKETIADNIRGIYNEDEITSQYGIPKEYVDGFIFYLVEDESFKDAIKKDNKQYIDFLMMNLAKEYLKLKDEK